MAIVRIQQIISTGSATNINLGFVPDRLDILNLTKTTAQSGVGSSQWFSTMANANAIISTLTAGAPVYSVITTNGVTPFVSTVASQLWTETVRVISAITNAAQALVTSASHGFTAADIGVTTVTFSGVVGMTQINTLRGVIQSVPNGNTFTVNINTTSFSAYVSGGEANVITGIPPFTTQGFQVFNTPQKNNGFIGVTLGTGVIGSAADVLILTAFLDASFTSD